MSARVWKDRRFRKHARREGAPGYRSKGVCRHCYVAKEQPHKHYCPRLGRLRIEQRARERRALRGGRSSLLRAAWRWTRKYKGGAVRGEAVRLSKHLRGKAARRNRRGA